MHTLKRRGSKHNITRHEYLCHPAAYARQGNQLPHAKATQYIVRKIRIDKAHGVTSKAQASEYGLHIRTIEAIRSYKTWVHV